MDLSFVLLTPVIAITLSIFVYLIEFIKRCRPFKRSAHRLIRVNCWFCNKWTRVKSIDANSWTCTDCEQYNGFSADGDYNKTIHHAVDQIKYAKTPASNGLCRLCNQNAVLKVQQLTAFKPLNEQNWERELEQYEKTLEKAYKLCENCQAVVDYTLTRQKRTLNLPTCDRSQVQTRKRDNQHLIAKKFPKILNSTTAIHMILCASSTIHLIIIAYSKGFIPQLIATIVTKINDRYLDEFHNFFLNIDDFFDELHERLLYLFGGGLTFQILLARINDEHRSVNVSAIVVWSYLLLSRLNSLNVEYLNTCLGVYLICINVKMSLFPRRMCIRTNRLSNTSQSSSEFEVEVNGELNKPRLFSDGVEKIKELPRNKLIEHHFGRNPMDNYTTSSQLNPPTLTNEVLKSNLDESIRYVATCTTQFDQIHLGERLSHFNNRTNPMFQLNNYCRKRSPKQIKLSPPKLKINYQTPELDDIRPSVLSSWTNNYLFTRDLSPYVPQLVADSSKRCSSVITTTSGHGTMSERSFNVIESAKSSACSSCNTSLCGEDVTYTNDGLDRLSL